MSCVALSYLTEGFVLVTPLLRVLGMEQILLSLFGIVSDSGQLRGESLMEQMGHVQPHNLVSTNLLLTHNIMYKYIHVHVLYKFHIIYTNAVLRGHYRLLFYIPSTCRPFVCSSAQCGHATFQIRFPRHLQGRGQSRHEEPASDCNQSQERLNNKQNTRPCAS